MDISIKPLTPGLLDAYLSFFDTMTFEENPDWAQCYCFSFHFTGTKQEWNRDRNRASVNDFVNDGRMTGYLAFHDEQPVGWCNVNKRENYQSLLKYYNLDVKPEEKACSLVCFLVRPEYRRQGIAGRMLERISSDYSKLGYDFIEVYPAKGDLSAEGLYRGPIALYERNGFRIEKELDDYLVMRKALK